MKEVKFVIMGFGNVGKAASRILIEKKEEIKEK